MDTKKKISLTINSTTPIFRERCTSNVWYPPSAPSALTSLNHRLITPTVLINPSATP